METASKQTMRTRRHDRLAHAAFIVELIIANCRIKQVQKGDNGARSGIDACASKLPIERRASRHSGDEVSGK